MARLLKQSTAFTFRIGPFVDDTDGKTAETGLSIGQADIQISKAGGAFAQTSASPTTTHDADGWYQCPLTATDTNTLGTLTVQILMSGALPVWEHFMVLPANVYDSIVAGSDYLQVDVEQLDGDGTAAANLNTACDNYSATRGLSGTALPAAAADAAGGLPISDAGGLDLDAKLAATNEVTAARMGALTDWINGGRLDLILDTIAEDTTTDIPALIDALPTAAENADAVWDEAATGHTDAGKAGQQLWTDVDAILTDTGTTLEGHLTDIKGATFSGATDSLEALRDRGDAAWATATGFSTHSAADVWGATNATLSLTYAVITSRLYRFLVNKMNITDATGAVALRNEADDGNIATQTISDDDTTTVRTALSWA